MKRVLGISTLLISLTLIITSAKKKDFEGTITYDITYLDVPDDIKGMESMLPQLMEMSVKGSKMALHQDIMMGGSQTVVVDSKDSTSFILMNIMGQKIAVIISKEELRKEASDTVKPIIELFNETKVIIGYKCKKAIMTQGENKTTIYYTNKLGLKHMDFSDIDGFPLEYETNSEGMMMKMSASMISEKAIEDSAFEIPEGYTKMTMEELNESMDGGE